MRNHNQLYSEIGERIRDARKASSMTQETLAAAISLTRTSITNIEKGRQNFPVHTLLEIAEVLRVPFETLVPPAAAFSEEKLENALAGRSAKEQAWIRRAVFGMKVAK